MIWLVAMLIQTFLESFKFRWCYWYSRLPIYRPFLINAQFLGYVLALTLIIYCWAVVLSLFRQLKKSLVPMGPPVLSSQQEEEKRSNDSSTSVTMSSTNKKENDLSGHVTPMLAEEGGLQSQPASSLASSEHNNGYDNNGFLQWWLSLGPWLKK